MTEHKLDCDVDCDLDEIFFKSYILEEMERAIFMAHSMRGHGIVNTYKHAIHSRLFILFWVLTWSKLAERKFYILSWYLSYQQIIIFGIKSPQIIQMSNLIRLNSKPRHIYCLESMNTSFITLSSGNIWVDERKFKNSSINIPPFKQVEVLRSTQCQTILCYRGSVFHRSGNWKESLDLVSF